MTSGDDGGECFLVERYESDVEEEGGASASSHTPKKVIKGEKQLMLVISERFLEEKSSMGDKVLADLLAHVRIAAAFHFACVSFHLLVHG